MKRIRYYLDTTMFNFAFADDANEKRELTVKFFDQLPDSGHGIYISEEVIREISRAPEPRRSLLDKLLRRVSPFLLEIDNEAEELAERYLR